MTTEVPPLLNPEWLVRIRGQPELLEELRDRSVHSGGILLGFSESRLLEVPLNGTTPFDRARHRMSMDAQGPRVGSRMNNQFLKTGRARP